MTKEKERKDIDPADVNAGCACGAEAAPSADAGETADKTSREVGEPAGSAEKLAAEAAEWKDRYVRLSAEFDNFRKRTLREKMDLVSSAGEEVIRAMLPVIDDLERALAAMEKAQDVDSVRQGVVLIYNKLCETLHGRGLSEIEAVGKELDTDFHEAVAKIPAPQEEGRGRILDVVQKGYKLHDKVIRHSKVVVGE